MSATLSGLGTLKKWLASTEVFECNHRPVPLAEYTLEANNGALCQEPPRAHRIRDQLADISDKAKEERKSVSQDCLPESETHRQITNLKIVSDLKPSVPVGLDSKARTKGTISHVPK